MVVFYSPRQAYRTLKKQLLGILGGVKRWTGFLWWNLCNVFNGLCSGSIRVLYLVNLLFLKIIFILISLVLLVQISNSCVSEVATENIYLFFFCCTGPFYVQSCLFTIQIFFFCILVSLKKNFIRSSWNIWNKYIYIYIFLLIETTGWRRDCNWFSNGWIYFEVNHDYTKKSKSDKVLHFSFQNYTIFINRYFVNCWI